MVVRIIKKSYNKSLASANIDFSIYHNYFFARVNFVCLILVAVFLEKDENRTNHPNTHSMIKIQRNKSSTINITSFFFNITMTNK